jgi:hypothetical protein
MAAFKSKPFLLSYYPSFWLVWICYGPPAYNEHEEFKKLRMEHLTTTMVTERREGPEEIAVGLGKQSKIVRRASKANAKPTTAITNDEPDGSVQADDRGTTTSITGPHSGDKMIRFMKELPPPTANECLDTAISSIKQLIDLTPDDDPEQAVYKDQLRDLYKKKAKTAIDTFNRLMATGKEN